MNFEILTCDPLICTMNHHRLISSNQMEELISIQRVNESYYTSQSYKKQLKMVRATSIRKQGRPSQLAYSQIFYNCYRTEPSNQSGFIYSLDRSQFLTNFCGVEVCHIVAMTGYRRQVDTAATWCACFDSYLTLSCFRTVNLLKQIL